MANPLGIPDNVVSRIKKLLAAQNYSKKGDGSITEQEVSIAGDRVQELLAQWNIQASQIEAMADPTLPPEEKRVKEEHNRVATYEYQKRLWAAISDVNFCIHFTIPVYKEYKTPDPYQISRGYAPDECDMVWTSRKVASKHYIVGRESNVIAVKLLGDYIEDAINRLCPYKNVAKKTISWKEGCTERLRGRLQDKKFAMLKAERERQTSSAGPMDLILSSTYKSEYEKNIDAEYGEGTSASWALDRADRKAKAAYEAEVKAREEERRQMVLDCPAAFSASEYQKTIRHIARLRKEAEEEENRAPRRVSGDNYWEGKDLGAWYEGRKAGDSIGLEPQMGGSSQKEIEG